MTALEGSESLGGAGSEERNCAGPCGCWATAAPHPFGFEATREAQERGWIGGGAGVLREEIFSEGTIGGAGSEERNCAGPCESATAAPHPSGFEAATEAQERGAWIGGGAGVGPHPFGDEAATEAIE